MKRLPFFLFFSFLLSSHIAEAQFFFRIKADVTIRENHPDGSFKLAMGQVFYDSNYKKIVYRMNFPENEVWVFSDTVSYLFQHDSFISKQFSTLLPEWSIFSLAMRGNLKDFGLNDNPAVKLEQVEQDGAAAIKTYKAQGKLKDQIGHIKLKTAQSRLQALIVYTPNGHLSSRQFMEDYLVIKGLEFPSRVTQFLYESPNARPKTKKEEHHLVILTTFENIKVNRSDEEYYYNYPIP